jgi:hypothetical protein
MIAGPDVRPGEEGITLGTAQSTDYAGIVTLGMGLGCLQVFLEEGHQGLARIEPDRQLWAASPCSA